MYNCTVFKWVWWDLIQHKKYDAIKYKDKIREESLSLLVRPRMSKSDSGYCPFRTAVPNLLGHYVDIAIYLKSISLY